MTGKGKNKNIIPGKKMKEGAISTLAGGRNKIPNSICKPNPTLMDSTTIDTSGVPAVPVAEGDNGNQNNRLTDLERRVGEIGKLMETIGGETGDVVGEQINAAKMTVEARIEKLELSIAKIIARCEEVKETRFNPDNNTQRKMTRRRIKFVPPNTENFDEEIEQFTKFFSVEFEEKHKRTINPYALREEIIKITGLKPKRIHSANKTSFTVEAQNKIQSSHMTKLNKVEKKTCVTKPHIYHNQSKGII